MPAMTPMWMPSRVVPPWMSPTSLRSATVNRSHEESGSKRARTPAWVMYDRVDPCEVRRS